MVRSHFLGERLWTFGEEQTSVSSLEEITLTCNSLLLAFGSDITNDGVICLKACECTLRIRRQSRMSASTFKAKAWSTIEQDR